MESQQVRCCFCFVFVHRSCIEHQHNSYLNTTIIGSTMCAHFNCCVLMMFYKWRWCWIQKKTRQQPTTTTTKKPHASIRIRIKIWREIDWFCPRNLDVVFFLPQKCPRTRGGQIWLAKIVQQISEELNFGNSLNRSKSTLDTLGLESPTPPTNTTNCSGRLDCLPKSWVVLPTALTYIPA